MPMQLTIENAKKISDDIYLADLDPGEIEFLSGRPVKGGKKSVVIIEGALFEQGTLKIRPDSAFIANVGSTSEAVFVDRNTMASTDEDNISRIRQIPGFEDNKLIEANKRGSTSSRYYWITVGKGLQENFELALSHGVWGVEAKYNERIDSVKQGDYLVFYGKDIGFALCQAESSMFEDRSRIWPDGVYPYRVRISQPLKRNMKASLSDVSGCLIGPGHRIYTSVNAAGRAIGGAAGVFRPLVPNEQQSIFAVLNWEQPVEKEVK